MKKKRLTYIKNILLPCLLLSIITGALTGGLIFIFKVAASAVISLSTDAYAFVRENPAYLPCLLLEAAVLGLIAALILKKAPNCRGGGIPTSIALLRGLIPFHWLKSVFLLFGSAMLSYLCGVPLGNEGPSVQMGTALGRGTVRVIARKNLAWDRYIMTGGACAGFAAATGAPLSGIFFAFEEAHRRFSPMIFMVASMTVIASTATMELLCDLAGISSSLFSFTVDTVLPLKFIWAALAVGIACGICAIFFTKLYRLIRGFIGKRLAKIPFVLKIVVVFVAVSLIGFASEGFIGSGHSLVDELIEGHGVWYMLIIYFCVRAILLMVANNSGVTGGLFVPTLAFGAILGSLCGDAMISLGILPDEYYIITVVIGMASFLAASSRTPITAVTFAAEALCGLTNILPITVGVTFAFLVIETFGVTAFTDTVIEGKVEEARAGKTATIVDAHLTVKEGAFVVGKEIRDILWPPTCAVLSVTKNPDIRGAGQGITEGDILHVHYQTYDPEKTITILEALVGAQEGDARTRMRAGGENHQVPEL